MVKTRAIIAAAAIILAAAFLLNAALETPVYELNSPDNPNAERSPETSERLLRAGNQTGVVLVHGLGATAWETGKLAEYLNERNITTLQVVLAGHNGSIYELEKSTAEQWQQSVENAYDALGTEKRFVVGISLGGLTALELAAKKQIDGVILIAAPACFRDRKVQYAAILRFFKRYSHREIEPAQKPFYYENFPTSSVAEMVRYIEKVKKMLPAIKTPSLIIQSKNDPRLDAASAQYIYDRLGSEKKELIWLNSATHVPVIEYFNESGELKDERQKVMDKVYDFVR